MCYPLRVAYYHPRDLAGGVFVVEVGGVYAVDEDGDEDGKDDCKEPGAALQEQLHGGRCADPPEGIYQK